MTATHNERPQEAVNTNGSAKDLDMFSKRPQPADQCSPDCGFLICQNY
jgi:hypothetical protein